MLTIILFIILKLYYLHNYNIYDNVMTIEAIGVSPQPWWLEVSVRLLRLPVPFSRRPLSARRLTFFDFNFSFLLRQQHLTLHAPIVVCPLPRYRSVTDLCSHLAQSWSTAWRCSSDKLRRCPSWARRARPLDCRCSEGARGTLTLMETSLARKHTSAYKGFHSTFAAWLSD